MTAKRALERTRKAAGKGKSAKKSAPPGISQDALAERALSRSRLFLKRFRSDGRPARRTPMPACTWTLDVRLIGDSAMRRLNRSYRRKDYATDILSFAAPAIFREQKGMLGELVICLPVLRRQAREHGHPIERELDVLLVHGLLHLLGFDHERGARAAAEMARWEARLLDASKGLIARSRSGKS